MNQYHTNCNNRRMMSNNMPSTQSNAMRMETCPQTNANSMNSNPCCETTQKPSTACHPEEFHKIPLAMAYVPLQSWKHLYEPCEAIYKGTLFKELNLDFLGRRCN